MDEDDIKKIVLGLTKKLKEWDEKLNESQTRKHDALLDKVQDIVTQKELANPEQVAKINTAINGLESKMTADGMNFVPFFDRGEDVHNWLRSFESCADFKQYDTEKKIRAFRVLMKNSAATWFDVCFEQCKQETALEDEQFDLIKEKFINRFDRANEWLQQHIIHFVSQKEGQSVQQFYSQVIDKCTQLKKSETEKQVIFIKGLRPSIKLYVLSREPSDLEQAFKLAKTAESLESISDLSAGNQNINTYHITGEVPTKDISPQTASENIQAVAHRIKELRDQLAQLDRDRRQTRQQPGPTRKNYQGPRITCNYCGRLGHYERECRTKLMHAQNRRMQDRPPPRRFIGYRPPRPTQNLGQRDFPGHNSAAPRYGNSARQMYPRQHLN